MLLLCLNKSTAAQCSSCMPTSEYTVQDQAEGTLLLPCSAPQMAESVANRCIGQPLGQTLAGKRVLVFGLGNIGQELLPR